MLAAQSLTYDFLILCVLFSGTVYSEKPQFSRAQCGFAG